MLLCARGYDGVGSGANQGSLDRQFLREWGTAEPELLKKLKQNSLRRGR